MAMLTVLEVIQRTTEFFGQHGLSSPRLNAELLVGHVLGLPRMQLYLQFERPLVEAELERLRPLVRRRSRHEPVQYVIGTTEFDGLRLKVDARALIPRPETELLVELVIEAVGEAAAAPLRIVDLGTGSGAIALALAKRLPGAQIAAVDIDAGALDLARENAATCQMTDRVRFLLSDWFENVGPDERFDVVIANPPYLAQSELDEVDREVREFEPARALVAGGEAGADALEAILAQSAGRLTGIGLLALETGPAQHALLQTAAAAAGYRRVESRRDLTGRDRFILAWR